jgi:hypothetical protein
MSGVAPIEAAAKAAAAQLSWETTEDAAGARRPSQTAAQEGAVRMSATVLEVFLRTAHQVLAYAVPWR